MKLLQATLLLTAGVIIGGSGVSAIMVANADITEQQIMGTRTLPIYSVYEASIKDEAAYTKALPEVQKIVEENHGARVAGGFNKAKTISGASAANRYVIVKWDSEADFTKALNGGIKAWIEKNAPDARQIMVEGTQ